MTAKKGFDLEKILRDKIQEFKNSAAKAPSVGDKLSSDKIEKVLLTISKFFTLFLNASSELLDKNIISRVELAKDICDSKKYSIEDIKTILFGWKKIHVFLMRSKNYDATIFEYNSEDIQKTIKALCIEIDTNVSEIKMWTDILEESENFSKAENDMYKKIVKEIKIDSWESLLDLINKVKSKN